MDVYILGYPDGVGGALSEMYHTARLWRAHGVGVTFIPTWWASDGWRGHLKSLGCRTLAHHPRTVTVPPGSIVAAFANVRRDALKTLGRLQREGAKVAWLGCMTYISKNERYFYEHGGKTFTAYVFQSRFQRDQLQPIYGDFGVQAERCHRIPGAFDVSEFAYRPRVHRNGDPFVIGRLSRAHRRKFSKDTWKIYSAHADVEARVLGWNDAVRNYLGEPPENVEVLPMRGQQPDEFLSSLHALVHAGGQDDENWPRFVLEAMASGTPIITDNRGGIPEMLWDGQTACLCDNTRDFIDCIRLLRDNQPLRMDLAARARTAVEEELADPDFIWSRWEKLFAELTA